MKYKIVVVSYSMDIGGVERALLGLLQTIDYSNTDLTLKLVHKRGYFLKVVPDKVTVEDIKLINENWSLLTKPLIPQIVTLFKKNHFMFGFQLLKNYLNYKINGHYHSLFRRILKRENNTTKYDLAISYAGPSSLLDYYVANHITARRKVAWIHFDVNKCGINVLSEKLLYPKFDKIFVVSEEGKRKFDQMFPSETFKSEVFHNLVNSKNIKQLSLKTSSMLRNGSINIVTTGRLSKEKGQDLAIEALANLIDQGYNVYWTFVGGGIFMQKIKDLAINNGIEDYINITGEISNPYPYMRECDIYVQPSRHEGFCITLAEAKLFGMPIVATDFTGAREQLRGYHNGYVVKHNANDLADRIADMINNKAYLDKCPSEPDNSDFKKFESLLNG